MRWKKFLVASTISLMVAFPQNIIGCGGWIDPYDYYVSFYWNDQVDQRGYDPFYYTGMQHWYSETDSFTVRDANNRSWRSYFDNKPAIADVDSFIYSYPYKQLADFYNSLEKNKSYQSQKRNEVIDWFVTSKDLEALGYIMYARQVEPHVTGTWDAWEPVKRDSLKISGLIKNGLQLHKAAKKDDIKLRYAYQVIRLAHYSNRYDDCINFYNLYVRNNVSRHFLKPLCLAHKAGAFYKKGESDSATYLFSLAFAQTDLKRLSNMQSFEWSRSRAEDGSRDRYLGLCRTNAERANMLGMFALQTISDDPAKLNNAVKELKTIASLDPFSPLLELITTRLVNMIEEFYFTSSVYKASGTDPEYYSVPTDENLATYPSVIKQLEGLLLSLATDKKIANSGFYMLAAAHLAFIRKDYAAAQAALTKAKSMQLNPKQKDQWNLTQLLITIGKQNIVDPAFESSILSQLKWLDARAAENETWKKFYRDLFVEILAPRYHRQNKIARKALCLAAGYQKTNASHITYNFLRNQMNNADLLALHNLMESKKRTAFEEYLVSRSVFTRDDVRDVVATSFIRTNNWVKAEEWLKKIPASYYNNDTYKVYLAANSFADLLYDTHAPTEQDTVKYTKLKFAQKMKQLEKELATTSDNNRKAKIHYQLANGLYQMSYWGNSWMLQAYWWSSGYSNPDMAEWGKEYYGVYRAEEVYKKASELSADPEFKARCLFMAAKCDQKQAELTGESKDVDNGKNVNAYFSQIAKNYNTTAFFQEALNTCSYFSDFVKKNNK